MVICSQVELEAGSELAATVKPADGEKCERCWTYETSVGADAAHPTVCARCAAALR